MEAGLAPEGEPSYGWSLWCNMLLNVCFTILLYLLITEKFEKYPGMSGCFFCLICCWLFAQIIINIVEASKNGYKYQPISYYWTIGMIPFLSLFTLNIGF
mmetsp:Transcript_36561/g.26626  ORF Transcript_36561/g.26626 Transcript_36561/m.26626 type:complete len:100 (-) Transcript_36561:789-1088(-)